MLNEEFCCLVIDLSTIKKKVRKLDQDAMPIKIRYASSSSAASEIMAAQKVRMLVIFSDSDSEHLSPIFNSFQHYVGMLKDFIIVVSEDPTPWFLATMYEYGLDAFVSEDEWESKVKQIAEDVLKKLGDPESEESKIIRVAEAIRSGNAEKIDAAVDALGESVKYDYRAALAKGKALEATSNFSEATQAFMASKELNKLSRPSLSSLAEAMIQTGQSRQALKILESLEATNPKSGKTKSNLAVAHMKLGNLDKAKEYLDQAGELLKNSRELDEAKIQLYLEEKNYREALQIVSHLNDVGPAIVNSMVQAGLKLARSKDQTAMELFQAIHRAARSDLKYQVSLNAALSSYILEEYDLAMIYLDRCQVEYNGSLESIESIRQSVLSKKKKAS